MITFIPYDTKQTLLIGGQSSLGGASSGNIGPMPTYNINREDILTPDGTYLGSKYAITINGTALLSSYNANDLKTKGDRQNSVHSLLLTNLKFAKYSEAFGNGKLDISAYGGMPNNIIFNDARLMSVSLAEQNEESSGTQYANYTFNFEAYDDGSNSINSNTLNKIDTTWKLSSAEESWSLTPNDQFVFNSRDLLSGELYRTFTLTHTLTATGLKKYKNQVIDPDDGHAWRQAAGWINERLGNTEDPDQPILKDLTNNINGITAQFHPFYMNKNSDTKIQDLKTKQYKARNKVRSITSNISGGSYTITDTWLVSLDQIKAIHEVEINIDTDINSEYITVSANGTVTGLSELDINNNKSDKYDNALSEYKQLLSGSSLLQTKIGLLIKNAYDNFSAIGKKTNTLLDNTSSYSESHDKLAGTIQWNVSVNDNQTTISGAISQKVNYTYENDELGYHEIDRTSITEVIKGYPIIFDSGTTPEKKLKIQVDLIMNSNNRNKKPDGRTAFSLLSAISKYTLYSPILVSDTETWNPKNGQYTLNMEYIYV